MIQTADAWRRHEVADALAAGIQLTRHASAIHARTLTHAHRTLETIASASETADLATLERVLHAAVEGGALLINAGVLEADGRVITVYRDIDGGTGRALRGLLARSGIAAGVGEYVVDADSGHITVLLAEPVARGPMPGLAFGVVELSWLNDAIERATLPADSVITVFDRNGRMLREPKPPDGGESHQPAAVVRAALAGGGEGTAEATDSVSRVYAYAPLLGATPPEHLT